MPLKYLLALLATVILAAGATLWLLIQFGSGLHVAVVLPAVLIAALAFRRLAR